MENDEEKKEEENKQIIMFTKNDLGITKFDLIAGKEVIMLFNERKPDSSE